VGLDGGGLGLSGGGGGLGGGGGGFGAGGGGWSRFGGETDRVIRGRGPCQLKGSLLLSSFTVSRERRYARRETSWGTVFAQRGIGASSSPWPPVVRIAELPASV
jgi:hypothetical protein